MGNAANTTPNGGARLPTPEALPADGFTRWNSLRAFVPFSRETVRKREKEGRFPRRQHLGSERCAAWPNRELHRWFADPVNYRAEG
ncbi:TPA: AlpA family phage regulatory protein [Burkholderia vietnamiensis]|uniref:helix-turn-helix transcriptional regulator n=1 Tax=Burkholderia vietnamiensis TaxID=60552 RepID=UPI002652B3C4|nr:AlpA family phage regulatory protein [Burkholderia vietnamiensis]MDN7925711.1 AlpA family phage regulatory protein [Burkholderia vietnamiensis]HDR9080657.1 AlpA family phage regulatory protein [Burkholderia vietnamiensis]